MTATSTGPRTYGNWRRARGFGIGHLSTPQSLTLFVAVIVPILAAQFSPGLAVVLALPAGLLVALSVVPIADSTGAQIVIRHLRFGLGRMRGETELASGLLTDLPRGHDLPGVMAPMAMFTAPDGRGNDQAWLHDRRTGALTTILKVAPVGIDLADRAQADGWVASWGAFLAELGYLPTVKHVTVTVDTSPSGGHSVAGYVAQRTDPAAPRLARSVLEELVARTPARSAEVHSRVSITFDPARAQPRPETLTDAVAEATRRLPGLESALAGVGVAVLGRANVTDVIGWLRVAYDPAARSHVSASTVEQAQLQWSDAGPVRASEHWDHWRHESGLSVSWGLREAPRQAVTASVLAPLLSPGPYPRRATLLYQPLSAHDAAANVEAEITNNRVRAAWAARTRRDPTQRDHDDQLRALQAAREEAQGAGVGQFTLYVTTTVQNPSSLSSAAADVEQRAGLCKLRLRRLRGAQSAGFAASLGVGINPAELARRASR